VPDASQTSIIYQRLRVAILDLDLAPGLRLTERWLEAEFRASRTPVRAALFKLEGEGLVQRSGRGWIVSPIDLGELASLAEFRETIEVAAIRLACLRASDADVSAATELLRTFRPGVIQDDGSLIGADFHVELARLSDNPFFIAAIEGVMTRLARTRWLEVRTPAASEQANSEHEGILEALATRDAELAADRLVAHIRNTRSRLDASLRTNRIGFTARGVAIVGSTSEPTSSPR
jgi:DNA-binding GntR family transcriptional regulator